MIKRLEYYQCLLDFLDDHIPCLDELIEQFDECWNDWEIEEDDSNN